MPAKTRASRTAQPGLYEVLTETIHGHQTVHRVHAQDEQAAATQVKSTVADTTTVLNVAKFGDSSRGDGGST